MRVLITGAGGQLGRDLQATFVERTRPRDEVVAADHARLDVADRDAVLTALLGMEPDVVVHAAAWTDVDSAERDPARALAVNALGTRHVAEGARMVGAHVVYISTDYVFDGRLDRPYSEWDEPCPLSTYGRSKLGGERELGPGATIVRTSWLCGRHGTNAVRTALRLATEGGPLRFVDDQQGCPTFTADLAPVIRSLSVERRPGLFHVTNQGHTTRYGLVRAVLEAAGDDPGRVEPISTADLSPPRAAARPANSVLENTALRLSGIPLLPDWHESLARLVGELRT